MSDGLEFCRKGRQGLYILEGSAYSFQSGNQERRIGSLNKDYKAMRNRVCTYLEKEHSR